ncbi:hypothetical protein DH2020_029574 [Rehmannia glutinosa]|uniref:Peptidyl-prolyl cis-trans isomerase n=1 Tax=Rehmannia glutinosa TaxID=99300 RepID=A0ABR0VN30_REHGL
MSSSQKVKASHILIKHEGSWRKSSWKDPEGTRISATTRDNAVAQLKTLRDDILAGKTRFDDVASRFSDCSSAKRGGDLGPFGRGQMQKPFEDATFNLKVGEISDIVDTDSGVHIIMRSGLMSTSTGQERGSITPVSNSTTRMKTLCIVMHFNIP